MIALANIIFPAPSAAYVNSILLPLGTILALGTELLVYSRTQRGVTSSETLLGIVIVLNGFSWVVGLLISVFLPSGFVPTLHADGVRFWQPGPYWEFIAILSYPFACIVSAVLEYLCLRLLFRGIAFRSPFRTVVRANVASYLVLGGSVLALIHLS